MTPSDQVIAVSECMIVSGRKSENATCDESVSDDDSTALVLTGTGTDRCCKGVGGEGLSGCMNA